MHVYLIMFSIRQTARMSCINCIHRVPHIVFEQIRMTSSSITLIVQIQIVAQKRRRALVAVSFIHHWDLLLAFVGALSVVVGTAVLGGLECFDCRGLLSLC